MIPKYEPLPEVQRIGEPVEQRLTISYPSQPLYDLGSKEVTQYTAGRPDVMLNGISKSEAETIRVLMAEYANLTGAQPNKNTNLYKLDTSKDWIKTTLKRKPGVPNKMAAADPRWGNKVAWPSAALMERQTSLETYSVEVDLMFDAVRTVIFRTLGKKVANEAMRFSANFGSPITNNVQRISVLLEEPISLKIILVRSLVNGRLRWTGEIEATLETPMTTATGKTLDVSRGNGDLPVYQDSQGTEPGPQGPQFKELPSATERRLRKVKL